MSASFSWIAFGSTHYQPDTSRLYSQLLEVLNRAISLQQQHMYDLIPTQRSSQWPPHYSVEHFKMMNPDYEIRQMAKAQGSYKVSCPLKMQGMTHLQVSSTSNHRQIRFSSYSDIQKSFSSHHTTQLGASIPSLPAILFTSLRPQRRLHTPTL